MIDAIIFDLGNVLLDFDPARITHNLRAWIPDAQEAPWRDDSDFMAAVHAFERGAMTSEEFHIRFCDIFGLVGRVPFDVFTQCWSRIFTPNEEMIALLEPLARQVRLVLLSNTNALHIAQAERAYPEVFRHIHTRVYSHIAGCAKPEAAIYAAAIDACGTTPDRILYVDDIPGFTAAGRALGLLVHTFRSAAEFRNMLSALDIQLPSTTPPLPVHPGGLVTTN